MKQHNKTNLRSGPTVTVLIDFSLMCSPKIGPDPKTHKLVHTAGSDWLLKSTEVESTYSSHGYFHKRFCYLFYCFTLLW